jgi:hypothetical protein
MSTALDGFKAETKALVDQYLTRKIEFSDCQILLGYAFTKTKLKVGPSEHPALTEIVITNNARVMREAQRRERALAAARERYRNKKYANGSFDGNTGRVRHEG